MTETVNGVPSFGASGVKLPPAAFRLESLDFDPTGNPYYKFPPFLSPPNGTPLVPFHEFKARGILISFDSDLEEVDGEGIPTIELGTKHGPTGETEKRKRKKRSKLDVEPRKGPWWEEWGEGEELRRADCFDLNTPRRDRFSQGAYDFQQNRHWTPVLQSLYDHFRHFCGLLGHPTKNDRHGGKGGAADDNEDEDDEEELIAEQERQADQTNPLLKPFGDANEEPRIHEIDAECEAELEAKDIKMDTFLNDPEGSVKIFFSSYYKDKGLFWSESKLRDGPILLSFFFSFFIRNKIMTDYDKVFRKALKITEIARLELPQTTKISMAIPEQFGGGCAALWGSKLPIAWGKKNGTDVDGSSWPIPTPEPVKEWEEALREKGIEQVGGSMGVGGQETFCNWGIPTEGVENGPIMGGWGESATVLDDGAEMWGPPGSTMDWTLEEKKPCLMSIFGPTTIPLTHAVQLVEKSTRQIVYVAPPDPVNNGLGGTLGTMVLAPWKYPKKGESTILPPELLSDLPEGSTFDMGRDLIKVFANPKTAEVMREGMGLHAVFVQVVEVESATSATSTAEVTGKKPKSRNKGKGKAKSSDDKEWWYIEFLYEVLPSFWTEEGD